MRKRSRPDRGGVKITAAIIICYVPSTLSLLRILTNDAGFKVLSCFSPFVEHISQCDDVTVETLLFSAKFDAEYSPTGVISKIYR